MRRGRGAHHLVFDDEDCHCGGTMRGFAGAPRGALRKHEVAFLQVVTDRGGQRTARGRSISSCPHTARLRSAEEAEGPASAPRPSCC